MRALIYWIAVIATALLLAVVIVAAVVGSVP